jgi:4-diphosphocytidyl-2-C-methyl-D-erythritol kinase
VLAKPPIDVSTADVYGKLNAAAIQAHPSTERMKEAVAAKSFEEICRSMGNVLEDVTMSLHPEVRQIKECMQRLGADGVLMSGSGPTVFGLVRRETKAAGIYNGLRCFCKDVFAIRMLI